MPISWAAAEVLPKLAAEQRHAGFPWYSVDWDGAFVGQPSQGRGVIVWPVWGKERAPQKSERFAAGRRGEPSIIVMSVQNYMKTFAPAPKELKPVQTAAKRTGADRLTAGQVNRNVDKLCLQTWPSAVLASTGTLYEEQMMEILAEAKRLGVN